MLSKLLWPNPAPSAPRDPHSDHLVSRHFIFLCIRKYILLKLLKKIIAKMLQKLLRLRSEGRDAENCVLKHLLLQVLVFLAWTWFRLRKHSFLFLKYEEYAFLNPVNLIIAFHQTCMPAAWYSVVLVSQLQAYFAAFHSRLTWINK